MILCSGHLTLVLAVRPNPNPNPTRHPIHNLPNLHFHICKYKWQETVMTQRSAWCSPCTISLEATLGGRPAAGKAQERTLESDCRALPTLLCPEHLQDFVVQAFLELIQRDSLHDKWSTRCLTQSLFEVPAVKPER